ncbi:unnamed protein product, partial [Ectocarpus fasciculatus]
RTARTCETSSSTGKKRKKLVGKSSGSSSTTRGSVRGRSETSSTARTMGTSSWTIWGPNEGRGGGSSK